ncbi:MAG: hypothetical protein WBB85_11145 [Albidovulum sp.]|uniref:hypothetical protein n=1 Tax=Albidovulum sp. TaxID=1872424 RepID=UPI003C920F58
MLRRLLLILLLSGLGTGPAVMGRMAVDHARAEIAPVFLGLGDICGSGPDGTGQHPHCDYCQIASHSIAPVAALQARRSWAPVRAAAPVLEQILQPARRWTRPPANAPPVPT